MGGLQDTVLHQEEGGRCPGVRPSPLYRRAKVIQSYLRIWGTCDPIESGSSDPKGWGLCGCSVKKCRFSGQKWAPAAAPRPAVQRGQHKNVVFLLSSHDGDKKFGRFPKKKWISGQKTAFLAQNSAFPHATPMKPPFFRVRRNRLNGITSPPHPEATLDTFGPPAGGRPAARRAASRPRLPKVALFGPKSGFFGQKSIFLSTSSNFFVT